MVLIPHEDTKMKHNLKDLLSSQIELDFHFIRMHLQITFRFSCLQHLWHENELNNDDDQ